MKSERANYLEANKRDFFQQTFCQMFHETAMLYGDKMAVYEEGKSITYQELDLRSSQAASYFLHRGIKQEEIAAIQIEKSVETIICMLGIWKAGGAYVFIDETYPEKRNQDIIEECGCRLVIDKAEYANIDFTSQVPWIDCSRLNGLAILIYTSGSTAKPKGVMLEHGNIMAAISNYTVFHTTEQDRLGLFPSFSFVASVFEMYSPLALGAALYLIPEGIRKNIKELLAYYIEHRITMTFLPPHMARKLLEIEKGQSSLRLLLVGSEAVRNLKPAHFEILNVYASSELTSLISHYRITDSRGSYPIGVLNPTIEGCVVDEEGQLVEEGGEGELWLSGPQVCRGYFHRKEEQEASFVEHSFQEGAPLKRYFKTKDMVKRLPDGNLEFICRKDNMYKIRGFRVEAGAVESVILECSRIKEVVVKAFTDSGGCDILCGFFVTEEEVDVKALKAYLRKRLPYYMVPTCLIEVKEFERNINQKIKRGALKAPKELDQHKLLEELY